MGVSLNGIPSASSLQSVAASGCRGRNATSGGVRDPGRGVADAETLEVTGLVADVLAEGVRFQLLHAAREGETLLRRIAGGGV